MKKNFESPLCTQAFDSVIRQRPLAEQLFNELLELSRDPEGGVTRAPYSPEETRIHQRFGDIAEVLGLAVTRDAMANYNVPACQDTKLKNLSYILLPFLSAYAAIRYC